MGVREKATHEVNSLEVASSLSTTSAEIHGSANSQIDKELNESTLSRLAHNNSAIGNRVRSSAANTVTTFIAQVRAFGDRSPSSKFQRRRYCQQFSRIQASQSPRKGFPLPTHQHTECQVILSHNFCERQKNFTVTPSLQQPALSQIQNNHVAGAGLLGSYLAQALRASLFTSATSSINTLPQPLPAPPFLQEHRDIEHPHFRHRVLQRFVPLKSHKQHLIIAYSLLEPSHCISFKSHARVTLRIHNNVWSIEFSREAEEGRSCRPCRITGSIVSHPSFNSV